MKKKCLLTALFGCMVVCASAQISLSGKVVDARTGKPVEGANVRLEQTTIGCATNPKGEFLLKDIKEGTYTLRTSCLNYAPVTQKVSQSQKEMVIRRKRTSFNMDQVVVHGPGKHHRLKDSPVPVEVTSKRDLQNANLSSGQEALVKLVP